MNESGDRDSNSPQPQPGDSSESLKKDNFLYPQSRYYGKFTPEYLAFNANLQEFANRVSIICNLETNGKMPPQDAYQKIKQLWEELDYSKSQLIKDEEE